MPNAAIHPTPQELTAFALGKLTDAAAATVARHLETCPVCRQAIEKAPADSFVGKLRAARPSVSSLPARPGQPAKMPSPPLQGLPPELANYSKYRFVRELGRGGMGVVYQAEQTVMGRSVAVKVINPSVLDHPDALPRFQSEVIAAAKLDHPNIVRAFDAEQVGSMHLLVMEFVEGASLADLVANKGPLSVPYACHYVRQAALGLQHAFEQGMVHRDIKPQNLMVNARGQIKVLDFGLARMRSERKAGGGLTAADAFMGTPEYVSPEQATDARSADTRADIYSLGCTLFFLLTGRPPFQEDTIVKQILAQIEKEPPALHEVRADVSVELSSVVARMLAKDPAQRFQTPVEVAQALAVFVKPGTKRPSGISPPASGVPSPERGTVIAADTSKIKAILREVPGKAPAPEAPAKEAASVFAGLGAPVISAKKAKPARKAVKPVAAAALSSSKRKWLIGGGIGIGVLLLALLGMWASGVFVKPTSSRISLLPESTQQPNSSPTDLPSPLPNEPPDIGLLDPNPRIFIGFHDKSDDVLKLPTMRFGLLAKDAAHSDQTKKLTFDEHGRSNNTVVRLDEKDILFGEPPGEWVEMNGKLRGEIAGRSRNGRASSWGLLKGLFKVIQEVELVPGNQSRLLDTCLVRYILDNRDTVSHEVGIRFMLDTFIGANDNVPFAIPGAPDLCDTKMRFNTPDRVPDFIEALEKSDPRDPGTVAYLQFRVGKSLETPSRVMLGGWPNPAFQKKGVSGAKAQLTGWDVPFISIKEPVKIRDKGEVKMKAANDSAVVIYWDERPLEPGNTRIVGFTYGLGYVDTRESGGHLLLTVGGRMVPNVEFSLMALVHNPKVDETLTLELPVGIETEGHQIAQKVPAVPAGAGRVDSPVTWRLRASKEGNYELTVRSSAGAKQRLRLNIRTGGMFD